MAGAQSYLVVTSVSLSYHRVSQSVADLKGRHLRGQNR